MCKREYVKQQLNDDKAANLYRYYAYDTKKQLQLCEVSTWKDVIKFTEKCTLKESAAAISYVYELQKRSRKEDLDNGDHSRATAYKDRSPSIE
jgi:hypothetical protein